MTGAVPGVLIAAPASASGKTTVTLALLRALKRRGIAVSSVKVGPDYIDPAFHHAAGGRDCLNLDGWAMRRDTLAAALAQAAEGAELIVGEGVMGLFDGAPVPGEQGLAAGSTAELAALTGWPVVLVVDCRGMGASVAALTQGFARFHDAVDVAGVILNNVASPRHEGLLREACDAIGLTVFGAIARDPGLARPSRHLGLVQAGEDDALDNFLSAAARAVEGQVDLDALRAAALPARLARSSQGIVLPPLGQRIAVAGDVAFAFTYRLVIESWRRQGAEVVPFSPLEDAAPDAAADAVYLPGGYPELHLPRLAACRNFLDGLRDAAARGAVVYGECGGYMVLGQGLEEASGQRHALAGLLPLESSFKAPRRHLGYRRAVVCAPGPLGAAGAAYRAHEFHYAQILGSEGPAASALFQVCPAAGGRADPAGQRQGSVMGSFLHLIDSESA
jgi:cobyrinic acid a,c-diamide synthase